jgi:dihydroxy-acid dehydratase
MASTTEHVPEEPRYIEFPEVEYGTLRDGKLVLNRWSHTITNGHDFPGAQVCSITSSIFFPEQTAIVALMWKEGQPG